MNGTINFESYLYRDSINNIIINDFFKNCNTEEDIRKSFEIEVNRILHLISAIPYNENIIFKSETKTTSGRIDSEYRNLIFEYKRYDLLKSESQLIGARNQLFLYLSDKKFNEQVVFGFLFDGKQIEIWKKEKDSTIKVVDKKLNGILCNSNLDYIFRTIFLSSTRELSSDSIKEQFSIVDCDENKTSLVIFRKLFSMLRNSTNKRTEMLFNEWMKMFKLSESDKNEHLYINKRRNELTRLCGYEINNSELEYKALFSMHSSFAIIIKLLLLKMLDDFNISGKKLFFKDIIALDLPRLKIFLSKMEHGDLTKQNGLLNLLEGDYFSWYLNEVWDSGFEGLIKALVSQIDLFEDITVKPKHEIQDLFRDLYENFIPAIVRHCFGEYYTPNWLADAVIEDSLKYIPEKNINKIRAIDPCCGSGTFLINILQRRIKENPNPKDFQEILKGIVGIDLNPLAILMARINVFINIKHFIKEHKYVEFPIYLGDSTYSPNLEDINETKCLRYDMVTGEDVIGKSFELIFPYEMVNSNDFIEIIDNFEKYILSHNYKNAFQYLKDIFPDIEAKPIIKKAFENLFDELIQLEKKELNRIWLRIFANYLKTGVQSDFDIIVGNPPWVSWGVLPDNYRKKVKEKCRFEGLFSTDSNVGGNNLNICALITNKCCERWLNKQGVLGFLMPKSILFNKSFEGFRNLKINLDNENNTRLFFQEVIDWSASGHPFENVTIPFCTYIIGFHKQDYNKGISMKSYHKIRKQHIFRHLSFSNVIHYFERKEFGIAVLSTEKNNNFTIFENQDDLNQMLSITGSNYYHFRKGVGYKYPQRLFFKQNIDEELAEFNTFIKKGERLKLSENSVIIEKKYIRPLIMSYDLNECELKWSNNYVIAPYADFSTKPVTDLILKKTAPKTHEYLYANIKELSKGSKYNKRIQNIDEFYGLIRIGEYSYADIFVAIRDNTKLSTTIVKKIETHWGEIKTPFFDNHISFIAENCKGSKNFINIEEAEYIAKILRKPIVNKYIINSTDSRSINTRFSVKIPNFRGENQ